MKRYIIIFLLFIALCACKQVTSKEEATDESVAVRVTEPEYVVFREPTRTVGVLASRMEMKLSFKTGGIVRSVHVSEGEEVEEGTRLASLDLSEINASAQQASIAFEKSRRDYVRARNLYSDSVITLETLQDARSAYDMALSQKRVAEFNVEHSTIAAPADGIVQKLMVEKNEMIAPGHPAVLFATTENDWIVRVALADRDIVRFRTGDSASIEMDAFQGEIFPASVSEVGSFADPVTGTFEAELLLEKSNPEFRSGLIARAWLFPADSLQGWKIPFEAVVGLHGDRGVIYINDSGFAKKTDVITGRVIGDGIIISQGLEGGEQVIIDGAGYLGDGEKVTVSDPENTN